MSGGKAGYGAFNASTGFRGNTEYQQARGGGPMGGIAQDYQAGANKNWTYSPRSIGYGNKSLVSPGIPHPVASPQPQGPQAPPTPGALSGPGISEMFAGNVFKKYGSGDVPVGTNNAQGAYDAFLASKPGIESDPGFDSFYENARRQASEQIRREMAARGAYASSASGDMVSEALTNLAADEASKRADYNLKRLAEQRAWEEAGGKLASGADESSGLNSRLGLSWLQGLGDIFHTGQGDTRTRYQDMFGNEMGGAGAISDILGQGYHNLFKSDADLLDATLGMGTAGGTELQNEAKYNTEVGNKNYTDVLASLDRLKDLLGSSDSGKGGGGAGMVQPTIGGGVYDPDTGKKVRI